MQLIGAIPWTSKFLASVLWGEAGRHRTVGASILGTVGRTGCLLAVCKRDRKSLQSSLWLESCRCLDVPVKVWTVVP
jgi:hypothetical protein